MFEKFIEAVEPFGLTLVVIAGASLAGWVEFSNRYFVGVVVFGFGILFISAHILKRLRSKK